MELIKLITLSVLVTLCCAQESGDMPPDNELILPTPTPTTILVTATRAYRDELTYQIVYDGTNDTNATAYEASAPYRYARYNCHNRVGNGTIINRVPSDYIFTIFLQIPVLHFLDSSYKIELMESIRTMLNIDGIDRTTDVSTFVTPPEICIDGYDQAFVGSYDEGVMLRIYENSMGSGNPSMTGSDLQTAFGSNLGRTGLLFGTPPRAPLVTFEGERAISYNGPDGRAAVIGPTYTTRVSIGGCRQLDPDMNLYEGRELSSAELACRSLSTDEQDDIREDLAENPNPINYYLEAGDYVFAVLGSVAISIVLGLALLGYCIHPFFLA